MDETADAVTIFGTVMSPRRVSADYRAEVRRAARLSEAAGFDGALIFSDNNSVDPWVVAQEVLTATERISPLVALQPVYMHPYTVAKKISSYALLYRRRVCLNLVAGGSRNDLAALHDDTSHDDRYGRLAEYAKLIMLLLRGDGPVTFDGRHYRVRALRLMPELPARLLPRLYISGSSEAARQAGEQLGAVAVHYPQPPDRDGTRPERSLRGGGVRLGIIARDSDDDAWNVARERFPATRAGQIRQTLARNTSDSHWVAQLSDADEFPGGPDSPYWMGPFKNYNSFCPYLVGGHQKIADEISRYLDEGCRTFILDVPHDDLDYDIIRTVFDRASAGNVTSG